MKRNLTVRETLMISSMLFGMFFGAGNMIFPAALGVSAGNNILYAFGGMFLTAVGLPLLAVAALGITRTGSVLEIGAKVSGKFGLLFSLLLYLTIGPLFAVPRCASTSFAIGAVSFGDGFDSAVALAVFSLLFFAAVFVFSRHPGGLMTWIGKYLNPLFLLLLFCLIAAALLQPVSPLAAAVPSGKYLQAGPAFAGGFLEGYNTLDALAGLAFGIVVVDAVRASGVEEANAVAGATIRAGFFSCLLMGFVYLLLSVVSAQSAPLCGDCKNGSEILGVIAHHYFGSGGALLLFAIVTMACLKTAIGLVTSCAEAFVQMFPGGPGYRFWSMVFILASMLIANLGLTTIVTWCVPVLMFLYPLAIALILLAILGEWLKFGKAVYLSVMSLTAAEAAFDFAHTMIPLLREGSSLRPLFLWASGLAAEYLPFFAEGLGWLAPVLAGLLLGMLLDKWEKEDSR